MAEWDDKINRYLIKIKNIFNIHNLLSKEINKNLIVQYYETSDFGYRLFHSVKGSIHMALNPDGAFNRDGYYEHARIIIKLLKTYKASKVLELASGKGFNSIFLAQQNPSIQFMGIDLTPKFVSISNKKAKGLNNLSFIINNFQRMSLDSNVFDIVFEIESLCHASDMELSLSEVRRVLKPGGIFILFDGFRKPNFESFPEEHKLAAKLVESSMVVNSSWEIDKWLSLAHKQGFHELEIEDISTSILPNLKRFEFLARGFFKWQTISKILLKLLPFDLVKNAIAGLLMYSTVQAGLQGYYRIILKTDE